MRACLTNGTFRWDLSVPPYVRVSMVSSGRRSDVAREDHPTNDFLMIHRFDMAGAERCWRVQGDGRDLGFGPEVYSITVSSRFPLPAPRKNRIRYGVIR